jgi:sulfur-carrier protein adenylyltransferase/sulfurtransferase
MVGISVSGFRELLQATRSRITEVSTVDAAALLGDQSTVFLDVREPDEHAQGTIPGSLFVPRGQLEGQIENLVPDKTRAVAVFCASGVRSVFAADTMQQLGYDNVVSVTGGFNRWKDDGLRWETPTVLSFEQKVRYHRHVLLPEVGVDGQKKLLAAKVLLLGAGGLGSPAALYLAAAGVGTIGIVDMDTVDESNLQRQILHNIDRVGMPKVDSASVTLTLLNPDVNVVAHNTRLDASNVVELLSQYDLVIDGADNFPSRYLLNDASLVTGTPVVHGSIFRFDGQVTVFLPHDGPCYRCLLPEPPPAELAPSCAEAGVLGVLPGIVGSLQAVEAIKLILGLGESLSGRLLAYDSLDQDFRTYKIRSDPNCPACSVPADTLIIAEYDDLCAPHPRPSEKTGGLAAAFLGGFRQPAASAP